MSAPLVVNTTDGMVWLRRASTRGGLALYAPASVCSCPEFVMATEAELAEHGIAGSADVLPMPVGPEPLVDADRAKAPWGRDEEGRPLLGPGAHWSDVPELVDQELARIRGRVDQAQSGRWYAASDAEAGLPSGTVRTNVGGYQRTVGQLTNVLPGDRELILHAHDDLSWCLEMLAKFRARVAELEALLADAPVAVTLTERAADRLTRTFASVAALREDDPNGLHHTYRVSRDLPETGGAPC